MEGNVVKIGELNFCVSLLIHYAIKARIDAPKALQHIICRGIERRKIFTDTAAGRIRTTLLRVSAG
jgi:hypothetical protein